MHNEEIQCVVRESHAMIAKLKQLRSIPLSSCVGCRFGMRHICARTDYPCEGCTVHRECT
ncbi:MAG: hypothetical protein WCE81_00700 [Halobacteriota archaeon]